MTSELLEASEKINNYSFISVSNCLLILLIVDASLIIRTSYNILA